MLATSWLGAADARAQCRVEVNTPLWEDAVTPDATCTLAEAFVAARAGGVVPGCVVDTTGCSLVTIVLEPRETYTVSPLGSGDRIAVVPPVAGRDIVLEGKGAAIVDPPAGVNFISVPEGTTLSLKDVTFRGFDSRFFLSVISGRGGALRLDGVVFQTNRGPDGAAIGGELSSLHVVRSRFTGNVATGMGGAIYLHERDATPTELLIQESYFRQNATERGGGGAVAVVGRAGSFGADVRIEGSTFFGNAIASGYGGALLLRSPALAGHIVNSTFVENEADDGAGGAIHVATGRSLDLEHVSIVKNDALAGGGGLVFNPELFPGGRVRITRCLIAHNRVGDSDGPGSDCHVTGGGAAAGVISSGGGNWARWPDPLEGPCSVVRVPGDVVVAVPPREQFDFSPDGPTAPTVPLTSRMDNVCAYAGGEGGCTTTVDQRGVARELEVTPSGQCFPGAHTVRRVDLRLGASTQTLTCGPPVDPDLIVRIALETEAPPTFGASVTIEAPTGVTIDDVVAAGFVCTLVAGRASCVASRVFRESVAFTVHASSDPDVLFDRQVWQVTIDSLDCDVEPANNVHAIAFDGCGADAGMGAADAGMGAGDAGLEGGIGVGVASDAGTPDDVGARTDAKRSFATSGVGGGGSCAVAPEGASGGGTILFVALFLFGIHRSRRGRRRRVDVLV